MFVVIVSQYVDYLKTTRIAVETLNRKIRRLRKIFECLKEYTHGENPFRIKYVFRNTREEQGKVVRHLAFSKEQEEALRDVLEDSEHVIPKLLKSALWLERTTFVPRVL